MIGEEQGLAFGLFIMGNMVEFAVLILLICERQLALVKHVGHSELFLNGGLTLGILSFIFFSFLFFSFLFFSFMFCNST